MTHPPASHPERRILIQEAYPSLQSREFWKAAFPQPEAVDIFEHVYRLPLSHRTCTLQLSLIPDTVNLSEILLSAKLRKGLDGCVLIVDYPQIVATYSPPIRLMETVWFELHQIAYTIAVTGEELSTLSVEQIRQEFNLHPHVPVTLCRDGFDERRVQEILSQLIGAIERDR